MGNSSSKTEESVNNEQVEPSNENSSAIADVTESSETKPSVIVPPKFNTKDDFMMTWFSWKKEFFYYLSSIDKTKANMRMWGILLLNHMGPVGQEIHRTFPFYECTMNENAQENISSLIKKFDIYYLYEDKKRDGKDIDEYVNELKSIAVERDHHKPEVIVKEKVIQDISTQHFTGKAAVTIKNHGEHWIPFLKKQNLAVIVDVWKQVESMTQENDKAPKQVSSCTKSIIECVRCGTEHDRKRCPAWGVQCDKCKQFNHFTVNCKIKYVNDCTKCGTNHIQSRCPAFGELCTNCGKMNHFIWKCQIPFVNNCPRCGKSHAVTACPAQGQICRYCNKPNHLEERCTSRLDNTQ
ncbi:uncharacterized protein LOC105430405 [Pogonomyrmex barbatus]|uniref:Uncharacterized protein LOC105430405 n=1 Tax=Pogonomyrmex barbatus TaxID=144034 RepID=A0A6I9XBN0_9HYME|nr:uncharacterized protein LOC105430405 [Pogonomyrmex barbatus]